MLMVVVVIVEVVIVVVVVVVMIVAVVIVVVAKVVLVVIVVVAWILRIHDGSMIDDSFFLRFGGLSSTRYIHEMGPQELIK